MNTLELPKAMSSKILCLRAISSVAFFDEPEYTGQVDSHVTLYLQACTPRTQNSVFFTENIIYTKTLATQNVIYKLHTYNFAPLRHWNVSNEHYRLDAKNEIYSIIITRNPVPDHQYSLLPYSSTTKKYIYFFNFEESALTSVQTSRTVVGWQTPPSSHEHSPSNPSKRPVVVRKTLSP